MGAAGSTQVVLKAPEQQHVAPSLVAVPAAQMAADESERAERRRKQQQEKLAAAEDEVFAKGYQRGQQELYARIDGEVEARARGEIGRLQQQSEVKAVEEAAQRAEALRKRGFRAPMRSLECGEEEKALLACNVASDAGRCTAQTRAYEACAEKVLYKIMNPTQAAAMR